MNLKVWQNNRRDNAIADKSTNNAVNANENKSTRKNVVLHEAGEENASTWSIKNLEQYILPCQE